MPIPGYSFLRGSDRDRFTAGRHIGPCNPEEHVRVTIYLRRRNRETLERLVEDLRAATPGTSPPMSSAEFAEKFGADPSDIARLEQFAAQHGLTVEDKNQGRGTMVLSGIAKQMESAFQVKLQHYELDNRVFRVRQGGIYVPESLQDIVYAILGLDNRPQAHSHFRVLRPNQAAHQSYDPTAIATIYQFPAEFDGQGETVGIVELGGGYRGQDLQVYFSSLGLASVPKVTAVSVDGGQNSPSGDANSADGEVELDIEIVGSVAPGAQQKIFFAPNTDQGFVDAISTAVHDPDVTLISISWGQAESGFTAQAFTAFSQAFQDAVALNKTVFAATGDNGSNDGVTDGSNHVDFPASSPYVVACGGTTLIASANTITSETVWNKLAQGEGATGGGVSAQFAKPSYQSGINVPAPPNASGGRGVPDVAANADPTTGYNVLIDGTKTVIGGTSAVAPLYAALFARINQALRAQNRTRAGFVHPTLYQNPNAFNDITQGNNGSFSAGPGWDATTGLGSPDGTKLLSAAGAAGLAAP
jgi:kumamolisin